MEKVILSLLSGEEAVKAGVSRTKLTSGKPAAMKGKLYLKVGEKIFSCPDTREGRDLLLSLTEKPASAVMPGNEKELCGLALESKDGSLPDGIPLFGVPLVCDRCVMLFRLIPDDGSACLHEVLKELAPLESKDILMEARSGEPVLIRRTERNELDEIVEYASALCGTVESETGLRLRVGIGSVVCTLGELGKSFREAGEALATGLKTAPEDSVYVYGRMMLERFLVRIPSDIVGAFRDEVFRGQKLSCELLETVDMFFRCDLNLSVTARKMFIHRNTLTYRLDKIQRATGLDIRKMRDALIFRLLTALPEDVGGEG